MRTVFGRTGYQNRSRCVDEIPPELLDRAREATPPTGEPYYTSEGRDECFDEAGGRNPWKVGMLVSHPSFGIGIIKDRDGSGENARLTINFNDAGLKKIAVKYASLVQVSG